MEVPMHDDAVLYVTDEERRRAALAVCAHAASAVEARTLLDMLGLLDAVKVTRLSA